MRTATVADSGSESLNATRAVMVHTSPAGVLVPVAVVVTRHPAPPPARCTEHSAAPAATENVVRASALKSRTLPSLNVTLSDSSASVGTESGGCAAGSAAGAIASGSARSPAIASGLGSASTSVPVPLPSRREQTSQVAASALPQLETGAAADRVALTATNGAPAGSIARLKRSPVLLAAAPPAAPPASSERMALSLTSIAAPSLKRATVTTRACVPSHVSAWAARHDSGTVPPAAAGSGAASTMVTPVVASGSSASRHAGVSVTVMTAGTTASCCDAGAKAASPTSATPTLTPRAAPASAATTPLSLLANVANAVASAARTASPAAPPPLVQSARARSRAAW